MTAGDEAETRDAILAGARALWPAQGAVVELRCVQTSKGTQSGYFDDPEALARAAGELDGLQVPAVYVTLNPIDPALLARSHNRIKKYAKATTMDAQVTERTRLLIDLDAIRPSGISSTDQEHKAALGKASEIRSFASKQGWPAPIFTDSGNGAHLVFAIALQNDDTDRRLVQDALKALAARFDDDTIKIDQGVFNAARILKLPGTWARKGDDLAERPHRRSQLVDHPYDFGQRVVTREQLRALLPQATIPTPRLTLSALPTSFDLEAFLARYLVVKRGRERHDGSDRWIMLCPFNPAHGGTSAAVMRLSRGGIAFKCQHDECAGQQWADVREHFEPGYAERRAQASTNHADRSPQPFQSANINFVRADAIEPVPIVWFDRDRIPAGELSILEGDGGTGKSTVALDIVARKSRGAILPGGTPTTAGNVLVVADEDAKTTISARLQAANADRSKVLILTSLGSSESPRGFVIPDDTATLSRFIAEQQIEFVYLDALFNHFAAGLLPKNPQDARRALSPLAAVAHDTGATIIATRHWGKGARDASERGLGANEIKNVARSVLVIAPHPEIEGTYAVAVAKTNYGRAVPALTYRIVSQQVYGRDRQPMRDPHGEPFTVGRIEWGEHAAISANDLALAGGHNADEAAGREACSHFILDYLSAGEMPSAKIYEEASKRKFSASTTLRAARSLKVLMRAVGFPKKTTWALPTHQSRQDDQVDVTDAYSPVASVTSQSPQCINADVTGEYDVTAHVIGAKSTVTSSSPPPRARVREGFVETDALAARVAAREARVAI